MKTHPEGVDLFHADRRTDITKLVVAFRNFANAPKQLTELLGLQCRQYSDFNGYHWGGGRRHLLRLRGAGDE
jgi:hypothetical protein